MEYGKKSYLAPNVYYDSGQTALFKKGIDTGVPLPAIEINLLNILTSAIPGTRFSYNVIIENVWAANPASVTQNTLSRHISELNKKINQLAEIEDKENRVIKCQSGIGYYLNVPSEVANTYTSSFYAPAGEHSTGVQQMVFLWEMQERIKKNPDKEIRAYIDDLCRRDKQDRAAMIEILCGDLFQWILKEYTYLLHRSGLWFRLKDLGLEFVLENTYRTMQAKNKDVPPDKESAKLAAAGALYLYATSTFDKSLPYQEYSLKNENSLDPLVRNELRNLYPLSLLKHIQLEKSADAYRELEKSRDMLNKADAYVGLAKIRAYKAASESDKTTAWEEVKCQFQMGIDAYSTEITQQQLMRNSSIDRLWERKAEACRWAAVLGLFFRDLMYSEEMLGTAKEIYDKNTESRRYYSRFLSAEQALKIMRADFLPNEKFDEITRALEKAVAQPHVVNEFERLLSLFWRGIAALKANKPGLAIGHTDEDLGYLGETVNICLEIRSWVEAAEAAAVYDTLLEPSNAWWLNRILATKNDPAAESILTAWADHVVDALGLKECMEKGDKQA